MPEATQETEAVERAAAACRDITDALTAEGLTVTVADPDGNGSTLIRVPIDEYTTAFITGRAHGLPLTREERRRGWRVLVFHEDEDGDDVTFMWNSVDVDPDQDTADMIAQVVDYYAASNGDDE